MHIPFVDLKAQYLSIKSEIDRAIAKVIDDTAFIGGSGNKYVRAFEEAFAQYLGIAHCIGCGNGTDSLEILLKAYGVGSGDEVIIPAHSWFSTAECVGSVGAKPIFVDTHPDYYTIDVAKIEEKITDRTKAIIPVHLYGLPAEMDEIMAIARRRGLIVIEDCAQAHGAQYKGKMVGTIGNAASFSFFPGKNLGAYGDAGCMVTNEEAIAHTSRMIAHHGQLEKHNHIIEGRNSRLDGLHAAVLSVKLQYLEQWTDARIEHSETYWQYLQDTACIQLPKTPTYSRHVFHLYVVQLSDRDAVQKRLKESNIDTFIHYPNALPLVKAYASWGYTADDFPVASNAAHRILSLPMYAELNEQMIRQVVNKLKNKNG